MSTPAIASIVDLFCNRLDTLEHLLQAGRGQLGEQDLLGRRLADDMHPLGTQIAFTCNQPRNFSLWVLGHPVVDLDPAVGSLAEGLGHVRETRALLARVAAGDAALPSSKRLALGPVGHLQLGGEEYVDDFLLPNFYFHLVTVYAILRMSGARIGKQDFMAHLLPRLQRHIA